VGAVVSAGPLSRDQITALMSDSPLRQNAPMATSDTDTRGTPAPAAQALADDESSLAPTIADGVPVHYLDPAAAWASEVGARSGGTRLEAAVVARVKLLFDDEKADVREQQEWEAVFFPLDGDLDAAEARHVDYDDRDFRSTPPESAIYVLPKAELKAKAYFTKAKSELQDHLYRTMGVEVFKTPISRCSRGSVNRRATSRTRCGPGCRRARGQSGRPSCASR